MAQLINKKNERKQRRFKERRKVNKKRMTKIFPVIHFYKLNSNNLQGSRPYRRARYQAA